MAAVIRIPVSILEFAGLISPYEEHSALIKFYGWAVRIAFLFVLLFLAAFLAKKAGISLPWDLLGHPITWRNHSAGLCPYQPPRLPTRDRLPGV